MVKSSKARTPNPVREACAKSGNQATLAADLGVTQQAMSMWVRRGWVPLRRAQEIEALTGVPRERLMNPRVRDLVSVEAAL